MATEKDSVSTDAIGTLVVVLAAAVVAVGLAVTALVRSEQSELAASRETQANLRPLRELRASQMAELSAAPAWVNREKSVVSIPIDRAMELVLQEARSASTAPQKAAEGAAGAAALPSATAPAVVTANSAEKSGPSSSLPGATPSDPDHAL